MTNNEELYNKIDKEINPKYLRNVQTHQVISLLYAMIEMKYFGKDYQQNTVRIGNLLASQLEERKIAVVNKNNLYTQTHQLFLEMPKNKMEIMFENAVHEGVTLNTKKKPLFRGGYGIRLGLQEISRYNWNDEAIKNIAEVLSLISNKDYDHRTIKSLIAALPAKKIQFTFEKDKIKEIGIDI